jgi:hypothetical protein
LGGVVCVLSLFDFGAIQLKAPEPVEMIGIYEPKRLVFENEIKNQGTPASKIVIGPESTIELIAIPDRVDNKADVDTGKSSLSSFR